MKSLIILAIVLLTSCNLKEVSDNLKEVRDKAEKMEVDISSTFEYTEVRVALHWGTEEENNYNRITLIDEKVKSKTFDSLQIEGKRITDYVIKTYPRTRDLSFIEICFIDNEDNPNCFITTKKF